MNALWLENGSIGQVTRLRHDIETRDEALVLAQELFETYPRAEAMLILCGTIPTDYVSRKGEEENKMREIKGRQRYSHLKRMKLQVKEHSAGGWRFWEWSLHDEHGGTLVRAARYEKTKEKALEAAWKLIESIKGIHVENIDEVVMTMESKTLEADEIPF